MVYPPYCRLLVNVRLVGSPNFSVLMLHEQAVPAVTSVPITSVARHFPTSVLLQEQRDEFKPLLHVLKEDKTSEVRVLL